MVSITTLETAQRRTLDAGVHPDVKADFGQLMADMRDQGLDPMAGIAALLVGPYASRRSHPHGYQMERAVLVVSGSDPSIEFEVLAGLIAERVWDEERLPTGSPRATRASSADTTSIPALSPGLHPGRWHNGRMDERTEAVTPVHPADRAFADSIEDIVVAVHPNESHWWNHASFALPLLGAIAFVSFGLLTGRAEATGFGLFLAGITVFMLPVVLLTWRATATAIVLTDRRALALHDGRVLREVAWADVDRIERVETLGNVRWKLMPPEGQHLTVEGEIADVPGLIALAQELAGVRAN